MTEKIPESAGKPFSIAEWDRFQGVNQAIIAHGRRVGMPTELDASPAGDGATAKELDEFLKKQQDNENNDKED